MKTIWHWKTISILVTLVIIGVAAFIFKAYKENADAETALWHICVDRVLGGPHDLQKMPVTTRGYNASPYVIMSERKTTFAFKIDDAYYVQTISSDRVRISLDMKTKHPWIEFEYNYTHFDDFDCSRIDWMFAYNVQTAKLHCAAMDFPHTIKD